MMVSIAREVFDHHMPGANQIDAPLTSDPIGATQLLELPKGSITRAGFKANVAAALRYTEAWVGGRGAVPIFHLMEDAATAEISRAQVWQWLKHGAKLADGRTIDRPLVEHPDGVIDPNFFADDDGRGFPGYTELRTKMSQLWTHRNEAGGKYVVLVPTGSPLAKAAKKLADERKGEVVNFAPATPENVLPELIRRNARWVAVVVELRPGMLEKVSGASKASRSASSSARINARSTIEASSTTTTSAGNGSPAPWVKPPLAPRAPSRRWSVVAVTSASAPSRLASSRKPPPQPEGSQRSTGKCTGAIPSTSSSTPGGSEMPCSTTLASPTPRAASHARAASPSDRRPSSDGLPSLHP